VVLLDGSSGGNGRSSAWQEGGETLPLPPPAESYEFRVTKAEMQLLLRLRMLGAGSYQVLVAKTAHSMWGLRTFEVKE
jgi:hypothetical protein